MRIYISHPISGHDLRSVKKRIEHIAGILLFQGYSPVLPMDIEAYEHSGECPPGRVGGQGDHTEACFMRSDLIELLKCDSILLTAGWESSHGARVELNVAAVCGIPAYWWDEDRHQIRRIS